MILTITSFVPYNLAGLDVPKPSCLLATLQHNQKWRFLGNLQLQSFSARPELRYTSRRRDMSVHSSVVPGPPLPSDPSPGSWKVWIVGMIISVILPLWRNKWCPLLQLKDRFESVVETAEHVTEIVEEVAEEVEKLAGEVADHLPETGKLREATIFVENVAKETAKDAHLANEIIEKVEEVEKEGDALVETVIDQVMDIAKEAKDID